MPWSSIEKESEISPGTVPPAPPPKDPSHRPRKLSTPQTSFSDHRKQLAVLETSGGRVPSISRNPPTAASANSNIAPWSAGSNGTPTQNAWSSFYNDSNEDLAQLSPGFARPGTGSREDSMGFPLKDDRRPSVASATTVSSTGSKSSRGFHKRLPNFFGEDFPSDGRQNSDTSLSTPFCDGCHVDADAKPWELAQQHHRQLPLAAYLAHQFAPADATALFGSHAMGIPGCKGESHSFATGRHSSATSSSQQPAEHPC